MFLGLVSKLDVVTATTLGCTPADDALAVIVTSLVLPGVMVGQMQVMPDSSLWHAAGQQRQWTQAAVTRGCRTCVSAMPVQSVKFAIRRSTEMVHPYTHSTLLTAPTRALRWQKHAQAHKRRAPAAVAVSSTSATSHPSLLGPQPQTRAPGLQA